MHTQAAQELILYPKVNYSDACLFGGIKLYLYHIIFTHVTKYFVLLMHAAPNNFMVATTSTSITLTWSPPAQGTVQSYKLTITGGEGSQTATVSPPSTTRMFSSLTPFTQYGVTITAVDSMGRQGDFIIVTVTTNRAGSYCVYL